MTARTMLASVVVTLTALTCVQAEIPEQPLPFSHAVHVQAQAIECTRCHAGAETQAVSGLPSLRVCLGCHMKERGEEPTDDEKLVREVAARGGEFRWIQVTRNEAHVYFSHRAHVTFAEIKCEECHGDVAKWTEAPVAPNPKLTDMGACMACHREHSVSNSCLVCHR